LNWPVLEVDLAALLLEVRRTAETRSLANGRIVNLPWHYALTASIAWPRTWPGT